MGVRERNVAVERFVQLLAAGDFDDLARLAPGSRISAEQMRLAVAQYGRRLVPLPPSASGLIDYVAVQGAEPDQWSVVVPLFTAEEGRSDLTLELTMRALPSGGYGVQVDDIHVL